MYKAALLALALLAGTAAAAAPRYRTAGDCDGYPRIALQTAPGLCVGLVAERLGFLRGVAVIGSDIFVTDLGSRTPGRGRVLRLPNMGRDKAQLLLGGLTLPNGIVATPDGRLVIAESGRIISVDPAADPRAGLRLLMTGLPQDGLHNLAAIAIAADGSIVASAGSGTNNCENADGSPPDPKAECREARLTPPRGALLRFQPATDPVAAAGAEVLALGLRNAAALAFAPDGSLFAAANARDAISLADPKLAEANFPHDTLVKVTPGADYGWPYCFDRLRPSPEYPRYACAGKAPPLRLLPAHAAPLALLFYTGAAIPALRGMLLIAYHGYRSGGHRIVALPAANPAGATTAIVSGWDKAGGQPLGTPTGMVQLPDGSILITEDHNRSLLRLAVRAK